MRGPPIVAGMGRGARAGGFRAPGGRRDGANVCGCRLGQALRGPTPALRSHKFTPWRLGWRRYSKYRCRWGREISRSASIAPSPQPLSHEGRGASSAGRSCRAFSTKCGASDAVAAANLPSPLAGEGSGERGRNLAASSLPPQPACASLRQETLRFGVPPTQRVTTSRCIGASLASSLFWAANGTPLACIASCRISTSALNSSRRMSSPSCDSAMLRPL